MGIREFTVEQRGVSLPDYAALKPVGTVPVGPVYTSTDIAELAARLGSIDTFDRRGNVIWLDDFESSLAGMICYAYASLPAYTDGEIVISNETARNGAFSCKLTTPDGVGESASIAEVLPNPVLSKIGFEASFTIDEGEEADYIKFTIDHYDGTGRYLAFVKYYVATGDLKLNTGPAIVPEVETVIVSGLNLYALKQLFHTIKLVIDTATHKYVRVILDETTYDISAYSLPSGPAAGLAPQTDFEVLSKTAVAAHISNFVDDVILTQNEPPNV